MTDEPSQIEVDDHRFVPDDGGDVAFSPGGDEPYYLSLAARLDDDAEDISPEGSEVLTAVATVARRLGIRDVEALVDTILGLAAG